MSIGRLGYRRGDQGMGEGKREEMDIPDHKAIAATFVTSSSRL